MAGVRLNADEVVVGRAFQEDLLLDAALEVHGRLAARVGDPVQREDREPRLRPRPHVMDSRHRPLVAIHQSRDRLAPQTVVNDPGRLAPAAEIGSGGHGRRLVDRAVPGHSISESFQHAAAVALE